ncbi:hypothetical protein VTI74DRAFT_5933 [Chaetomium olivicolor]
MSKALDRWVCEICEPGYATRFLGSREKRAVAWCACASNWIQDAVKPTLVSSSQASLLSCCDGRVPVWLAADRNPDKPQCNSVLGESDLGLGSIETAFGRMNDRQGCYVSNPLVPRRRVAWRYARKRDTNSHLGSHEFCCFGDGQGCGKMRERVAQPPPRHLRIFFRQAKVGECLVPKRCNLGGEKLVWLTPDGHRRLPKMFTGAAGAGAWRDNKANLVKPCFSASCSEVAAALTHFTSTPPAAMLAAEGEFSSSEVVTFDCREVPSGQGPWTGLGARYFMGLS